MMYDAVRPIVLPAPGFVDFVMTIISAPNSFAASITLAPARPTADLVMTLYLSIVLAIELSFLSSSSRISASSPRESAYPVFSRTITITTSKAFGENVVLSCSSAIKLLGEPSTGTRILFIKSPLLLSNKYINIPFKYTN